MGKGADLARAAHGIEKALIDFVGEDEREFVHVFESSPGHLRAVVGSDRFKNTNVTRRQEIIWNHLKEKVSAHDLRLLWGVHPLDRDEYYEEHSPGSSSSSAYPTVDDREP